MRVDELFGSWGCLVDEPDRLASTDPTDQTMHVYACKVANMTPLGLGARGWQGHSQEGQEMHGVGCDPVEAKAILKARAEALERYCTAIVRPDEWTVASAVELGGDAFEWHVLPRLTSDEQADPDCYLHNFDPTAAIRWIPAYDPVRRRTALVPLVMTHLYPRAWTSERFWSPITTGVGLHTDPFSAISVAICEAIERDAITNNWLSQRRLRRIALPTAPCGSFTRALISGLSLPGDTFELFDATTDLGVPTVMALRTRLGHRNAVRLVGYATALSWEDAAFKAIRETMSLNYLFEQGRMRVPAYVQDCRSLEDGAVFMAQPDNAYCWHALDSGEPELSLSELGGLTDRHAASSDGADALVRAMRNAGAPLYIAELTTSELRHAGLRCFRAVCPGLMPLVTDFKARFLDSSRLAQFADNLRLPRGTFSDFPIPFA